MSQDLTDMPLLRLTSICYPEINDGKPTQIYLNPSLIMAIKATLSEVKGHAGEHLRFEACTQVLTSTRDAFFVSETPSEVARLRDAACLKPGRPKPVVGS